MKIERVLEVGGIDRPLLGKGEGFVYDGLDIDEKDNCYTVYDNYLVQSIENPIKNKYDLIILITLLEHVENNKASIKNIYESLNSNGITQHYIPSKCHPYSICLRMVGPSLQKWLIPVLQLGAERNVSGYPAYFNYCSVGSMRKLFKKQGFKDIKTHAFFAANNYFEFCTPIYIFVTIFENIFKALRLDIFASGFIISARKDE